MGLEDRGEVVMREEDQLENEATVEKTPQSRKKDDAPKIAVSSSSEVDNGERSKEKPAPPTASKTDSKRSRETIATETKPTKPSKKKRKKGGDAIDDLFNF